MSAPTADPETRSGDDITSTDRYPRGARVWVHCAGSWRPGIVLGSSEKAASVRYRPTEARGTAVDTVLAHKIVPRQEADPYVDELTAGQADPYGIPSQA